MSGTRYTMSGVPVAFPHRAYPSQMAMMSHIIRAIQKSQNALLESPTGSGKSLALLCAALAWQRQETIEVNEHNAKIERGDDHLLIQNLQFLEETKEEMQIKMEPGIKNEPDIKMEPGIKNEPEVKVEPESQSACDENGFMPSTDNEDDDFVPTDPAKVEKMRRKLKAKMADNEKRRQMALEQQLQLDQMRQQQLRQQKRTVAKIYFGTRTHKQIAQIIRELNKTEYRDVRMTILAARDHTCINPSVLKLRNRNEGCIELNDRAKGGPGCPFMSNVKNKLHSHNALNAQRRTKVYGVKPSNDEKSSAWELEELVKIGKRVRACPYYATRELMQRADIIFCPYNYLVEPAIRKSLDINLSGQVVILDEAHNIEDSARSAASIEITQDEIRKAAEDLRNVSTLLTDALTQESHLALEDMCNTLSNWMDAADSELESHDFASASKVWTGTLALANFAAKGLTSERLYSLKEQFEKVLADTKKPDEVSSESDFLNENGANGDKKNAAVVSGLTTKMLEGFFTVIHYLYMEDSRHRDDFRVALIRSQTRNSSSSSKSHGWLGKKSGANADNSLRFVYTLHFWCLNPAVTFDQLKSTVRSIVLTSGTLSPMASFSSELDVKFGLQLEANHVVDRRQVFIRTISHGPTHQCLNATFRNTETFAFQDELGRLVSKVCNTVSKGVLLFLPSYSLLNKLTMRWQSTGLWSDLLKKKVVISEPRQSEEFEASIRHFYDVIASCSKKPEDMKTYNKRAKVKKESTVDGALFIAVCRGKVSEGLDFADDNARAVVCVGIPFPNVKDIQVGLKKRYNDERRTSDANILSGNDWYEIQAFRALNQALGRCIRHKNDWGAIIMVDDRYQRIQRYLNGLSKWLRAGVQHRSKCDELMDELEHFMQINTNGENSDETNELKRALSPNAIKSEFSKRTKVC